MTRRSSGRTSTPQAPPPPAHKRADAPLVSPAAWIAAILVTLIVVVFAPVRNFGFVSWDDPWYVSQNPHVIAGMTWRSIVWAMTTGSQFYWHPLTWLSHLLDVQLYGLYAGGHHVTSVVLHTANTLLLFWLLRRVTGALWRSAFVAALFAVHPLHVESVAWVSERKDVLSTLFLLLTLWAYTWYVRQPGKWRYISVALLYAIGLTAKPMLVTLPLLLLLLDLWPLGRMGLGTVSATGAQRGSARSTHTLARLLWEKVPLVGLAIGSSVATFLVQKQVGAIGGLDALPLTYRVSNSLVSYVAYIGKALWPARLSAFYPYPQTLPEWWVISLAALTLVLVSVAAWQAVRQYPYVLTGWLWYLITLLPVIGLVQAGDQLMADRFTYVPMIGLLVVVAWGIPDLIARWSLTRIALPAAAVLIILACTVTARAQVWHWKDSRALWEHALEVTADNHRAHVGLGEFFVGDGRLEAAASHYEEAVRIVPRLAQYRTLLGDVYARQGRLAEATGQYGAAVRLEPGSREVHENLGAMLLRQGKAHEAVVEYTAAIRIEPGAATAHGSLGIALASLRRFDEAIAEYREALRLDPASVPTRNNLGIALVSAGRAGEALAQYREALRLEPDSAPTWNNLCVASASAGRPEEAVKACAEAVRLDSGFESAHFNLGVALAETGRTSEAASALRWALRINPANEAARRALDELTKAIK